MEDTVSHNAARVCGDILFADVDVVFVYAYPVLALAVGELA